MWMCHLRRGFSGGHGGVGADDPESLLQPSGFWDSVPVCCFLLPPAPAGAASFPLLPVLPQLWGRAGPGILWMQHKLLCTHKKSGKMSCSSQRKQSFPAGEYLRALPAEHHLPTQEISSSGTEQFSLTDEIMEK